MTEQLQQEIMCPNKYNSFVFFLRYRVQILKLNVLKGIC